mmetsp:Transcript_111517/g.197496  ORF Transcript_111517/g.197496 Transcript_111517/m.197496 type:complete len:580 (-) Transcript_111517:240-1979(-)
MGLFMERRLWSIAAFSFGSWLLCARAPISSALFCLAAGVSGSLYARLLIKTFQAVDLKPLVWGAVSKLIVLKDLSRQEFFCIDGADKDLAKTREAALERMQSAWAKRWPKAQEKSKAVRKIWSDLRFKASGFESTFPVFQKVVNEIFDMLTVVDRTEGTEVVDVDGCRFLDSCGSYGVNCFGHTKFKEFMDKGNDLAQQVGPCLGPMHPVVIDNIEMMLKVFRKEEASFHMSGTEAVMCAVQQVRFHTKRPLIAVFKGAYHGWWDGVMQGAGNPRFNSDCLVLKDKSPASLELLKIRANEIAGVIVNPISGMGWGKSTTADLATHKVEGAGEEGINSFRKWLQQIRETCTASGIPLIYDETWAFQLGPGGAQDLYGVEADIVTLGKALGGGHAVGAVVGPHKLMERRDPDRPMLVSFVVGTFKGSPMVMGSMNAVLNWVTTPEAAAEFNAHTERVSKWAEACNATLSKEDLPISVAAYRNMWCVCYSKPGVYNFLFHCYLRDAGLQMVWVGTSKMLLNLEFREKDFEKLTGILVSAAKQFQADGWWWEDGKKPSLPQLVLAPTLEFHASRLKSWLGLGR